MATSWRAVSAWISGLALAGCMSPTGGCAPPSRESDTSGPRLTTPPDGGAPPSGPGFPKPCAGIFADDTLQTFEIEIDPSHWQALQDDFWRGGQDDDEYRPLQRFRHAGKATSDAMIRLRGNSSTRNLQEKMQFQISFNERDPDGRFRGLRKIVLDANHYSKTYLRDRLAMSMARDAGLPAACVNNARLYVNGRFYGLYGNLEKIDREYLERNFEDPSGNLFKSGKEQKTNELEAPDRESVEAFWDAEEPAALAELGDLRQMIRAWALEALLPDADGYWAGGWNFYLYDHPQRGFVYLLWDIDQAFDSAPVDADPLRWHKTNDKYNGRPHVRAALGDPYWRAVFVEELRSVRASLRPEELDARIVRWAAQLRDSAYEDRLAPWSGEDHEEAVDELREHVAERFRFVDEWLRDVDVGEGIP